MAETPTGNGSGPVVVIGSDELAGTITERLRSTGRAVVVVDGPDHVGPVDVTAPMDDFRAITEALTGALRAAGHDPADGCPAVVFARTEPASLVQQTLTDMDAATWDRLAEAPVRVGLACLQATHPLLRAAGGGTFVLVAPAVAIDGASGLVPLSTAAEALRALAKSAGRRWAKAGITVNLVAPPTTAVDSAAAKALKGTDADRGDVVLPAASVTAQAAADTVELLLSPAARHLTGATLAVDGGALMAP